MRLASRLTMKKHRTITTHFVPGQDNDKPAKSIQRSGSCYRFAVTGAEAALLDWIDA